MLANWCMVKWLNGLLFVVIVYGKTCHEKIIIEVLDIKFSRLACRLNALWKLAEMVNDYQIILSAPIFSYAWKGTGWGVSGSDACRLLNMLHLGHRPTVFSVSRLISGQDMVEHARALHFSIPR